MQEKTFQLIMEQFNMTHASINSLAERMDRRFDGMEERLEKMDARFDDMDKRFDDLEALVGLHDRLVYQNRSSIQDLQKKIYGKVLLKS